MLPTIQDAGVSGVINPFPSCETTEAEVTVILTNWGSEMINDIPIAYSINGGSPVAETADIELFPGQSAAFTFSTAFTPDVEGVYLIRSWSELTGDTEPANDTSAALIHIIPAINTFPYLADFESDGSQWSVLGTFSTWETGLPAGTEISSPSPSDPSGPTAWMTNLDGDYNNREISYVISPCFDFTSLSLPYLSFDAQWDTEEIWDGAQLQYRTGSDEEWVVLGSMGSGENWYTSICAGFGYDPSWPSGFPEAWVGTASDWKNVQHELHDLAGETFVQFRFVFVADESVNDYDGFAFDNFVIADPPDNDLSVLDILSPVTNTDLGLEEVTVSIINKGTLTQSGFEVAYEIDGAVPVMETVTGELLPGDTIVYLFTELADLSSFSDYPICTWVTLATDEDLSNDTLCSTATNLAFTNYLVYSSIPDDAPWSDEGNANAMQAVFGDGWSLEFYETLDIDSIFDSTTCMVYLEGSDKHANELENFLSENKAAIETWVANGGRLFINAAPTEGDGMMLGFDSTSLHYPWYSNGGEAFDDAHPIFTGPYLPIETLISGSSFGHASLSGLFDTIMTDAFSTDKVVMAEKIWGLGRVVFGGLTTTNFHEPTEAAFNLRSNIIDYLSDCNDDGIYDLSLLAVLSPFASYCGADSAIVSVLIENLSGVPISDFNCSYSLDGADPITEVFTETIDAFSTGTFNFPVAIDLGSIGDYDLMISIELPLDVDAANDTIYYSISNSPIPDPGLPEEGAFCNQKEVNITLDGVTYLWSTGDTTSSILITESGFYSVQVIDTLTGCTGFDTVNITINYTPEAAFGYLFDLPEVTFTNLSLYAEAYDWTFGDGGTSSEENPMHTYSSPGNYVVKLQVTNGCGIDQAIDTLNLINNSLNPNDKEPVFKIFPNPGKGQMTIEWQGLPAGDARLIVEDLSGNTVYSDVFQVTASGNLLVNNPGLPGGVYVVSLIVDDKMFISLYSVQ